MDQSAAIEVMGLGLEDTSRATVFLAKIKWADERFERVAGLAPRRPAGERTFRECLAPSPCRLGGASPFMPFPPRAGAGMLRACRQGGALCAG